MTEKESAYFWLMGEPRNTTKTDIRDSMRMIWKAQKGMRTLLSQGLLLWNL